MGNGIYITEEDISRMIAESVNIILEAGNSKRNKVKYKNKASYLNSKGQKNLTNAVSRVGADGKYYNISTGEEFGNKGGDNSGQGVIPQNSVSAQPYKEQTSTNPGNSSDNEQSQKNQGNDQKYSFGDYMKAAYYGSLHGAGMKIPKKYKDLYLGNAAASGKTDTRQLNSAARVYTIVKEQYPNDEKKSRIFMKGFIDFLKRGRLSSYKSLKDLYDDCKNDPYWKEKINPYEKIFLKAAEMGIDDMDDIIKTYEENIAATSPKK